MEKCIGGCGFFGNASTFGLCSRCYKEQIGGGSTSTGSSSTQKAEAENKPSVIKCSTKISNITVNVCLGDLTLEKVDAICNAANSSLDHASGLAGAIKKRGGPIIQAESDAFIAKYGRLEDGQVAVTSAGQLPCKMVIHCVGPIWHGGDQGEELFLEVAIRACLDQAASRKCQSLAIPAISTGIFRFPKPTCASVMFRVIEQYAREVTNSSLQVINLTNFDQETVQIFEAEFHKRFKS